MKIVNLGLLLTLCCFSSCIGEQAPTSEKQGTAEVQSLLSTLRDETVFKQNPALAADTIIKLGQWKAAEAIPLLIKHIDFRDPRRSLFVSMRPPILIDRVAFDALIQIRKPSVQPVLEASKKEDNRLRLICMAAVIVEVAGKEKAEKLVDSAIAASKDAQEKARLEKLKSFILKPPMD